jgi:hypothetical protein
MTDIAESSAILQLIDQSLHLQEAAKHQAQSDEATCEDGVGTAAAAKQPVAEIENNALEQLIRKKLHDCVSALQLVNGNAETERLITFMVGKMKVVSSCLKLAVEEQDKTSILLFGNILREPCQQIGLEHLSDLIRRVNYELESDDWENLNIWIQLLLNAISESTKAIEKVYPSKDLSS